MMLDYIEKLAQLTAVTAMAIALVNLLLIWRKR